MSQAKGETALCLLALHPQTPRTVIPSRADVCCWKSRRLAFGAVLRVVVHNRSLNNRDAALSSIQVAEYGHARGRKQIVADR
jgi:hypothetical protein